MDACDRIRITVLDENYSDMLLPDEPGVERFGIARHFDQKVGTPLAENGIALLVEVTTGPHTRTILLDAGLTAQTVLHNAALLGVDLRDIDIVMLSHGHIDHFGGLYGVLQAIGRTVPLAVHPDAFNPRFISSKAQGVMPYINLGLTAARLEAAGAGLMLNREPLQLAPGVMASGPIAHAVDFEYEVPAGRQCIRDGAVVEDPIGDYQTLVLNLRGKGLIVLDPCGHAGVISSLRHAQKLSGIDQVHAVMGGFHLGHPMISAEKVQRTVVEFDELDITHVSPMHCSGWRTMAAVAARSPQRLRIMTAATVVTFEGVPG